MNTWTKGMKAAIQEEGEMGEGKEVREGLLTRLQRAERHLPFKVYV